MRGTGDGFGAFDKVFGPLERDSSLSIPEHRISLAVPAFAVPNGEKWDEVAAKVREWFIRERDNIPDNSSKQVIPGLSFPLTLRVWKSHLPGYAGKVFISRTEIPDTFSRGCEESLIGEGSKTGKSGS